MHRDITRTRGSAKQRAKTNSPHANAFPIVMQISFPYANIKREREREEKRSTASRRDMGTLFFSTLFVRSVPMKRKRRRRNVRPPANDVHSDAPSSSAFIVFLALFNTIMNFSSFFGARTAHDNNKKMNYQLYVHRKIQKRIAGEITLEIYIEPN